MNQAVCILLNASTVTRALVSDHSRLLSKLLKGAMRDEMFKDVFIDCITVNGVIVWVA